ncbi:hypothetical protein LTR17_007809 [Elasticomyces elasticus]|nr:hypothetical protein LTR17_007809 [Elasticomyces elasticus]
MPPKPQPPAADTKPPVDLTTGASANSPVPITSASATPSTSRPATPSTTTNTTTTTITAPRPSRGSSRGRVIATPKFTARRSATARAEAEKADNERKRVEAQSRAKEDAAKARREGRFGGRGRGGEGRGRGEVHRGRGRGGFMGERSGGDVASGPFSGGMAGKSGGTTGGGRTVNNGFGVGVSSSGGGGGGSGGGGGGGGGGSYSSSSSNLVKREPGGGGDSNVTIIPRIKQEDGGAISSDEEDEEEMNKGLARINVEDLGVIDLTQDDDNENNNAQGAFQPVRLKREAHVDRTLGLNADATKDGIAGETDDTTTTSSANDAKGGKGGSGKGKQRARDVEVTGASEPFQSTYSSSDEAENNPAIKVESNEDDGPQPIMAPPASPQPPGSSGARGKKVKTQRRLLESAGEMPVHQTQDEVQEWERRQKDLELIFGELGTQSTPKDKDGDGDANMTAAEEGENVNAKREAKVYLFQFPPVLPDLTPIVVKAEPDAPQAMDVDTAPPATTAATANNTAANPVNVAADTGSGSGSGSTGMKLPSGAVGKLRIHKSGKATLDWGGTKMSVGMGGEASFLQDVVILNLPEKKPVIVGNGDGGGSGNGGGLGGGGDEEVAQPGWAMGMGQVKGKFVVTPDWDELLG